MYRRSYSHLKNKYAFLKDPIMIFEAVCIIELSLDCRPLIRGTVQYQSGSTDEFTGEK